MPSTRPIELMGLSVVLGLAVVFLGICQTRPAGAVDSAVLATIADGLEGPSNFVFLDSSERFLVLEQHTGRARIVEDGRLLESPLFDISERIGSQPGSEEGLLGAAVSPSDPHELFVSYTEEGGPLTIVRLLTSEDGTGIVEGSEEEILTVERTREWHSCGHIAFGPDGLLYACAGDMTRADSAQDPSDLAGSILRIDVAGARPYAIPPDNPFVGDPDARSEVWMYGLRNAWRFSFDDRTGRAVIPDVGWNNWEEINLADPDRPGVNFGWPLAEGNECTAWDPAACSSGAIEWPAVAYHHIHSEPAGCSVIGGVVYYGERSPAWHGVYIFGDLCSGEIWAIRNLYDANRSIRKLFAGDINPSAVGPGPEGEVYLTDPLAGALYRLDLPSDFAAGWRNLAALQSAAMTSAARTADIALFDFLNQRVGHRRPPHVAMRQPPLLARLARWYEAVGSPTRQQMTIVAVIAAAAGVTVLVGGGWLVVRRRYRSRDADRPEMQ